MAQARDGMCHINLPITYKLDANRRRKTREQVLNPEVGGEGDVLTEPLFCALGQHNGSINFPDRKGCAASCRSRSPLRR